MVSVDGRKKRAVLAILLLHRNRAVSSECLIEELWGERQPATALQSVRVHVSQIRKALGPDFLRTLPAGYVLELGPDQLDARRFERLVDEGRAAIAIGDAASAAALLHEGLSLWRGPVLADFSYEPFAQAEIAHLEELRVAALEARIDADLGLGGNIELVGELEALVAAHPLREHFRAQLMLALYRAGRQSDALDSYREARRMLVGELGLEPSAELRALESAILRQDASLGLPSLVRQRIASQPAVRKTVTTVHIDLGSAGPELPDPEALEGRLEGPLKQALVVIGRHEGEVTSQRSDAVTATFGLSSLHEDDALRAIRAGVEIREQLAERYDLQPPIGIATGEVIASGRSLPFGAVAGSAARLANGAQPSEIILDDTTRRLVANAVDVEPLAGVPHFRLQALLPGAPPVARRLDAPLVGRRDELAKLIATFERTISDPKAALVVVGGEPGIGKSRLAGELIREVANRATVLVGRCLSYGQGITLWPLREMVGEAAGEETREALAKLLRNERDGPAVAERIAAALGFADVDRPPDETIGAFRRFFEALARSRPHVLVVEDAHWAEPALLDLLDDVARQATDVSLLIVCLSRPELFEARPAWSTGAIELAPLSSEDTEELIDNLPGGRNLSHDLRSRAVARAEGNPLFAEQLVALLGADDVEPLPLIVPTIHAILAARLDRLGPGERAVVERAAVVGREFTVEAVTELLPQAAASSAWRHLDALTRKLLVQPDRAVLPGQVGFRFQHALIYEAAYRRLPKALRAELHERFAGWLAECTAARPLEFQEVVGYHLEQAYHYRAELGPIDEHARTLASHAGTRLGAAGQRALGRWDLHAAIGLLERAAELLEHANVERLPLLVDLGGALTWALQLPRAEAVLEEAFQQARAAGDELLEAHALLSLDELRRVTRAQEPDLLEDAGVQRAIQTFEEHGDESGLAKAWMKAAQLRFDCLRERDGVAATRRALEHAERGSDTQFQALIRIALALSVDATSAHLAEVRALQEDNLAWAEATGSQRVRAASLALAARLAAREGRFEEAASLIGEARALFGVLGIEGAVTAVIAWTGEIAELADDLETAERAYREGVERATRAGDRRRLPGFVHSLGRLLDRRGERHEGAELFLIPEEDIRQTPARQVFWRSARARELARQGRLEEAVRLSRSAVALAEPSDDVRMKCEGLEDLVHVLRASGRPGEAIAAVEELVRLREHKGEPVAAAKARSLLERLRATAVA
ncbi:MAG TPA: BTAD domain-containing putative transcriptional regulator [Gaiellaceae bacterium]|nr:BTAD domain-containing putative transcriptional regulator [Gaiellaceae bacterium]